MKRKTMVSVVLIAGLSLVSGVANACCTGDYYFCESWKSQVIADLDENCGGCFTGEHRWIKGC